MSRQRVQIRFRKHGDLRYIGHRDLLRTLERLYRRAGLKLRMSEGFHPKPKMSFPSALAVGIVGEEEVMELELEELEGTDWLLEQLRPQCPEGLDFLSATILPPGGKNAPVKNLTYQFPVPPEREAHLQQRIEEVLKATSLPVERSGRKNPLDLRPQLEQMVLVQGTVSFTLRSVPDAGVRPREVLAILGIEELEEQGTCLTRSAVELQS
jgi:radical SAM-linked protein